MADFDPDAFMKSAGVPWPPPAPTTSSFDPDAFMREQGLRMPETMRDRERTVRQAIAAEPKDIPAGFAPAPVSERTMPMPPTTFAERAGQWGDVGLGAAKGVPAWLSGGVLGDIEASVRPFASAFGASPQNAIPTTVEGGYLGPRGYDILGAPKNEYEAMGRGLTSMAMPNLMPFKAIPRVLGAAERRVPPGAPPGPGLPGGPTAQLGTEGPGGLFSFPPGVTTADQLPTAPKLTTPRVNNIGQRIAPDLLPTELPTTGAAGAQRVSTLEGIDPAAVREVYKDLKGFTPHMLAQRLEEMSPHQFALEVSDPTWNSAEGIYVNGGQGGSDIRGAFTQRQTEAPDRIRGALDRGFGTNQDLATMRRVLEIDQNRAATPLYQAFRNTQIPPTPEMLDPSAAGLMTRLRAANALSAARRYAAIEGVPYDEAFDTLGTAEGAQRFPTAESWDLVKRSLDAQIADNTDAVTGKVNTWGRLYSRLKSDLISSIENHPDEQIGQLWRDARSTFAGYEDIKRAWALGRDLVTKDVSPDELRYLTAGYSDPQMAAVRTGMRNALEQRLGKPGPASNAVVRQLLGPNQQDIVRQVIGNERADPMFRDLTAEHDMFSSPRNLVYGSRTAPKQVNAARWQPEPKGAIEQGLSAAAGFKKFAQEKALGALNERRAARAQAIQDDAARIYTMQGPERDATMQWILEHGADYGLRKHGGRVVHRQAGGRVNARFDPRSIGARRNPRDGQWYVPAKQAGKWMKVVPR